ncbi:KH domain-containing protein [Patescibacteria group bacterium]|nr:KH domain-containing protein [Patescibacteria group bacterium]
MAVKKKETKKKKTKKVGNVKRVQEIADELLSLMGTKAVSEVSEDKEAEAIVVDLKTEEETGLLIGSRGETLNSIQAIIGMIYRQRTGEWQRIVVNVADWRERQTERLRELALQAAQRARETGDPQTLYNLTPAQRRTIHLVLEEEDDIETESEGEGSGRYLIVSPK